MAVLSPQLTFAPEARVAIAGDWHGKTAWAKDKIHEVGQLNIKLMLHVGDFGVWNGKSGKRFLTVVEEELAKHNMHLLVTPGNHEDWARLCLLWDNPKRRTEAHTLLPIQLTEHIQVMPRGWRFSVGDVSFLSFGGAASIDFETRVKNVDWWTEELPSWADVAEASKAGAADVMLTHETVDAQYAVHAVYAMLAHNPQGWSKTALAYSAVSRKRITKLFEDVKPAFLFHGHMHTQGTRRVRLPEAHHDSLVVSVDKDYEMHNLYILELAKVREAKTSGNFEGTVYTPSQLKDKVWRAKHHIEL